MTDIDVTLWPFSVPMLVLFTSFLSTLRWPAGLNEMAKYGISFLELLVLFEQWVGHRLLSEKTVPVKSRAGRGISPGSSPISDGVQIRLGCQFVGSPLRSLAKLPGGLSRFIPCSLGRHLSRLRHFWLASTRAWALKQTSGILFAWLHECHALFAWLSFWGG